VDVTGAGAGKDFCDKTKEAKITCASQFLREGRGRTATPPKVRAFKEIT
jgi:hypothetical protein